MGSKLMEQFVLEFAGNLQKQHAGHCVTCCLGDKWWKKLCPRNAITLLDIDTGKEVPAIVNALWYGALESMPQDWVECEHDPDLRTRDAIASALSEIYKQSVTGESLVTAIVYTITNWEELEREVNLHP